MDHFYLKEDQLILLKVREGNEGAFNELYEKHWERVFASAMKRLKDHDQAQDVTQDIFLHLWMKRKELQINNLEAYLYTAVRNRVLNLFEKEKRYIPIEQLLDHNIQLYGDQADAMALRREFLEAYKALVDSLPVQRRKIFQYHYDEDLSTEEIATQMKLSRKTVQNQLGRAVTFIRANLSHLFILLVLLGL